MAFRFRRVVALATFAVLCPVAARAQNGDAHAVMLRALRAMERDSVAWYDAMWERALTRNAGDRAALLGLATLARHTSRVARADTFANRLLAPATTPPDAFAVAARLGMATTLASGMGVARGDSLLVQVQREARALGHRRLQSDALIALAQLRARTQGHRAGLALVAESRAVLPAQPPLDEAQRLCIEGNMTARLGMPQGDSIMIRGVRLAEGASEWRAHGICFLLLAQLREQRGYFGRALADLELSVQSFRRSRAESLLCVALQWGAFVRYQQGDLALARRDYIESIRLARRTGNVSVEAWALSGLGQIAIAVEDLPAGRDYLARAAQLHLQRNDRWGEAATGELRGELHDALGEVAQARAALTGAIALHQRLGQRGLSIAPLRRLARLELENGDAAAADRLLQQATEIATRINDAGWLAELPYHQAGVAIARRQFAVAESLLSRIAGGHTGNLSAPDLSYSFWMRSAQLSATRGDFARAEGEIQRATAALAAWRGQTADKDLRLGLAQARGSWGNVGGREFPALVAQLAAAGRVAPSFNLAEERRARELAAISIRRVAIGTDTNRARTAFDRVRQSVPTTTVAELQRSLDSATAFLAYVAGRGASPTTLFVVTHRDTRAVVLPPVDSLGSTIDRYLRVISAGNDPVALGRRLGDVLLAPALALLPASISRLVIVPEQQLFRVPFDALHLPDGRFAVERFAISIAPSATWYRARRHQPPPSGERTLLAFGDPVFPVAGDGTRREAGAADAGGTTGVRDLLASPAAWSDDEPLPRLPHSGEEARRVGLYSARSVVRVREEASESALRRASLDHVGVLHLATHALVDDRSLLRSALALGAGRGDDGFLGPEELSALRLRDALVVLSGCRTVGGVVLQGEGLRGLTAPLLEAGARTVVASYWAVGDRSILPVIDRFYSHLAGGADVAEALRRAKREAIAAQVRISDWAAFSVVGDGALRVTLRPRRLTPIPWGNEAAAGMVTPADRAPGGAG